MAGSIAGLCGKEEKEKGVCAGERERECVYVREKARMGSERDFCLRASELRGGKKK